MKLKKDLQNERQVMMVKGTIAARRNLLDARCSRLDVTDSRMPMKTPFEDLQDVVGC